MIEVYDYLSDIDFIRRYEGLDNTVWADEYEALGVLYDYLEEIEGSGDEPFSDTSIRDWLRFEVVEMTADEIVKNYDVEIDRFSDVSDFLEYHTALYGTYEVDGETYYLFNGEF